MSVTPEATIDPVTFSGEALVDTYRLVALAGLEAAQAAESARQLELEVKGMLIDPETGLPLHQNLLPKQMPVGLILDIGRVSAGHILEEARADSLAKRRSELLHEMSQTISIHYTNRLVAVQAISPGTKPISRLVHSRTDGQLATHSVMDEVKGRAQRLVDDRYLMLYGRNMKHYQAEVVDKQANRLVEITLL